MRDQKTNPARKARLARGAALIALALVAATAARGETIGGALVKAYLNNPDINAQRAAVRATDEYIPQANAGYLPKVSANLNAGVSETYEQDVGALPGMSPYSGLLPRGYGVQVQQSVWDGNRTFNTVRLRESQVLGQREQLRNTEQNTLLNALTYYMNVMRDTAALDLNRSNVEVLKEQLRQTRDRFNVGEVTRTDVAQAEAALAQAQANYLIAQSTVQASIASYRQVVGDPPASLAPVSPVNRLLPSTLPQAVAISMVEHPAITGSLHGVDASLLQVKVAESALYPQVGLQASLTKAFDSTALPAGSKVLNGQIVGSITIPIYDGGATSSSIRQAKEQVTQQELSTDSQRDKVRQAVVAFWFENTNAVGVLRAARSQVQAAEVALAGVREEAKVGQRTTLDVLNAQQTLLQARLALVTAQHDQVVYSYSLLSSIGRLSMKMLGISVAEYDPRKHFDQVKTKQFGVRTPDGR
jgi:outer membrane protein